jgi:uncharacterized protein
MDNSNSDLVFNVAQLLKEPVGSTRKLHLATPLLELGGETEESGPLEAHDVEGDAKVTRMSRDLLVQGDVAAQVTLLCSRCLDEFTLPVDASLEEQYQPTIDVDTGRPIQRTDFEKDDTAFSVDPNHLMDLTEPVRQALLVALPLKPLCREDCAGLCPNCGTNWNVAECDCVVETTDNRWAGLRELTLEDLPAGDSNVN